MITRWEKRKKKGEGVKMVSGPFALGSFARKVGLFALIIMNIINIVIEIKEVTI